MKSPYLIFDFLVGWILLKLARGEARALGTYKLWMLNIVVLQSVYAVGSGYLIPVFFVVAALYAATEKKPYLSIILLSMAGATKLFPYILILPTALLLGNNWKKRILLLFTAGIVTTLIYLPFYLSSGNSIFGFFLLPKTAQYSGIAKQMLPAIFLVLYAFISIKAAKDSQNRNTERKLLYYFIVIMFLGYTVAPVRFRYFTLITPFLALIIPEHKKFGIFTLFIILLLGFSYLTTRDLQLGLFAPINPDYFSNIPTIQEIIGRFTNIEVIYKIMVRVLLFTFFAGAFWIWRIKLENEQE